MSPRAAWRLEQYGFEAVYEYTGGKEDWLAAGRRIEGHRTGRPALMALLRTEPPVCGLGDRAGDVLEVLDGLDFAPVVGTGRVVLGKLLSRHAEREPDAPVEEIMLEGPTTVRASEDPGSLLERMDSAETSSVIVTTIEGRLLGVAVADDLDAAGLHEHAHDHG